jgi:DNA topoisomerase-1
VNSIWAKCGQAELAQRRSKRGKTFYGCTCYPDCDFVSWVKPIGEPCPSCGSPYLVEKHLKSGPVAECPNKDCKYKRALEPVPAGA